MSESRLTTRVGAFVLAGLAVLAVLLVNFSKSGSWFEKTYDLRLRTSNVSGIKGRAAVLMAGVPVGYVQKVELEASGKSVLMTVRVYEQYRIRKSATFAIEQAGFLGDQYVAIIPREDAGDYVQPGETAVCLPPFDLQDTARRASDLLDGVGATLGELRGSVSNMNGSLLGHQALTNYATNILLVLGNIRAASESVRDQIPPALTNVNTFSEKALAAAEDLRLLVHSHTASVAQTIRHLDTASSNVVLLSQRLRDTGEGLEALVATNGPRVATTLKNIESASISVTNMVHGLQTDLQEGKGLVGGLLHDGEMKDRADLVLSNMTALSSNLNVAAANLNNQGLWWLLWKPKYPKTNQAQTAKSPTKGR